MDAGQVAKATQFLRSTERPPPRVGLVLGSGFGQLADMAQSSVAFSYKDIPHFYPTTVNGHQGRLILGRIEGVCVAILQGRIHHYEGHSLQEVVFPIRVLAKLGIERLILTNASGGINPNFHPGDVVCIADHINLMGSNPLCGPNTEDVGPRFPDMSNAYPRQLQDLLVRAACAVGLEEKRGVYAAVCGPSYETPAEVRMLATLGADMVGMSTVPEVIAANHLGIKVCAISCITNAAAGLGKNPLDHREVQQTTQSLAPTLSTLLQKAIKDLARMSAT